MSLKLYIWEDVLSDYTPGIAFALAENREEARQLCLESFDKKYKRTEWNKILTKDLDRDPDRIYDPEETHYKVAIVMEGGG